MKVRALQIPALWQKQILSARDTHTQTKIAKCLKLAIFDWSSKGFKLQSNFFSARVIFPCPCAVYMYKILVLLNNFSLKPLGQFSPNFISILMLKRDREFFSNGHTWLSCPYIQMVTFDCHAHIFKWSRLTVMPIYGKKKNGNKKHIILLQTQELLKMMIPSH